MRPLILPILLLFLTSPVSAQNLKDAVRNGLCESPSVRKAVAEAEKSFHEITETRADSKPQLFLDSSAGAAYRDRSLDGLTTSSGETLLSREVRFTVRQILFDFGTNRLLGESAELRNEFQNLLIRDVKERQARLIAETYLEVYKLRLQSNSVKRHLSDLGDILDDARSLEAVDGREQSVLLEGRVISTKGNLAEIVARLRGLDHRFKLLTTMDCGGSMQLTKMPTCICDHVDFCDSPRVKAADLAIRVSETNVIAARKDKLPKLYLEGRSGLGENVSGIDGADNEWSALLTLRWSPYDGGKQNAVIAQNLAEVDKDIASKDDVLLSIKDTVGIAQAELDGAIERRAKLGDAHRKMREGINLYQEKIDAGGKGITLLGLANAHREALSVELDSIDALVDSYIAAVRGLEASGGLLKFLGLAAECCK
ncbi:MAG: TolC family protein [Verrucomicrobiales bacterium]|nr:TolC family protein [Verrucomicrobiales bacterium]